MAGLPNLYVVGDCRPLADALTSAAANFTLRRVAAAPSLLQALRANRAPCVVIAEIDAALHEDGVLAALRRARDLPPIPLLLLRRRGDNALCQRALAAGATDFLSVKADAVEIRARLLAHYCLGEFARRISAGSIGMAHDPRSGLATRAVLVDQGEQLLAYAARHRTNVTAIRIDLPGFADFVAAGEHTARAVSAAIASALRRTARKEDVIATTGDGRFAVLALRGVRDSAQRFAARLAQAMARTNIDLSGAWTEVRACIGVATTLSDRVRGIEDLLMAAEQRVAEARQHGGGVIVGRDPEPVEAAPDLEQALVWLQRGEVARLAPYHGQIARRMLPLLKLCHEQFNFAVPNANSDPSLS
jgi:diguanylate cyclase (GGDEF)-like protein